MPWNLGVPCGGWLFWLFKQAEDPCPESWQENGACAAELVTFLIWMEGSCFAVNACVPMGVDHFQHGFITKGDGIKYVARNGTDTFYIFCLPNQRWCGTSVPVGFGPCGNFRMAWGNPVCHWDGSMIHVSLYVIVYSRKCTVVHMCNKAWGICTPFESTFCRFACPSVSFANVPGTVHTAMLSQACRGRFRVNAADSSASLSASFQSHMGGWRATWTTWMSCQRLPKV